MNRSAPTTLMLRDIHIAGIERTAVCGHRLSHRHASQNVTYQPYDGYYSLDWTQEQINEYKENSAIIKAV